MTQDTKREAKKRRRGPEAERVKIVGDWRKATAEGLKKPPMPKPKRRAKKR